MAEEISASATPTKVSSEEETRASTDENVESSKMDTSAKEAQINVADDAALQAVLSSMTEPEMHAFIEELNKTGKAYVPSIGQTIELLTAPVEGASTTTDIGSSQAFQLPSSAAMLLQELTSLIQQPQDDIIPMIMEQKLPSQAHDPKPSTFTGTSGSRPARTASTYGGTPVVSGSRPGTAVKSTVTSSSGATIRRPAQQQTIHDDRMFFGRPTSSIPTTIGQGQYHNRVGLMPSKQQYQPSMTSLPVAGHQQHQRRIPTYTAVDHHQQRRPLSWFPNRSRRHSSDDEMDSDRDSSPPSYSLSSNDNQGPTRRSARVPKPKQDADFVTFPLLDRDEHGNPLPPTPSSMPLHKAEDDEDDIPYRLMDYPRPPQQSQSSSATSSVPLVGPGRKPRTVAELRAATAPNKKQPRWPDDELYHVKSFSPLIMPQQITNPSMMRNKITMCRPLMAEREVEAKPTRCTIATQTEIEHMIPDVPLVTLPVPIYLPSPTPSYQLFKPRAVPIPVPVFVPIMIPVPKKAYKNIREYLQRQRDLLPDDPFEAALVLHAESLVRAENQPQQTTLNHVNESIMMMDLSRDDSYLITSQTMANLPELDLEAHYIDPTTSQDPEIQKLLRMLPDAEYRFKWTYGVEAFQQWCAQRNRAILYPAESMTSEEAAMVKQYLIKSDLLSYASGDELQHVLSVFITEARRPTGDRYLPESIYYLCLGIQFYLHSNNRPIDLFDPRYVEFHSTLDKILLNHSPRLSADSNAFVSLIDENVLYDAHQLGTLTPWSLLTTLIYTNTKYFNLKTLDSHMAISFANFGKYSEWGRLPTSAPQGQHIHYLRFYAHNADLKSLADFPTVYEITEQVNDPVHCPIKQYDFYVSKCPEQVRGAADVFYLTPLTEQLPESSLWFSTEPLPAPIIEQTLNRLRLLPGFHHQTKPVEMNASSTSHHSAAPATLS